MPLYLKKDRLDIFRQALSKLEAETPVKAISPGSVARALTESITTELGDYYDILDFNIAQSVLSTASGRALDLLGQLYNVQRRTLGQYAAAEQKVGTFLFYLEKPYNSPLVIPAGTRVYASAEGTIGKQLSFTTTEAAVIQPGNLRVYVSITPEFGDGIYSAGINTLTVHNFIPPPGVAVRCNNPRPVMARQGFESDDDYKSRILKGIRVASAGTLEAVRFAALGVNGIRDVRVRQTPYGLGSFEVLVVPEEARLTQAVLDQVRTAINQVRPVGVSMYLVQPGPFPVDISAVVSLKTDSLSENTATQQNTSTAVRNAITRYINSLLPGETLVYNKLIQEILDVSNIINDVQITRYAPNGMEAVKRNYTPKEYEQITPGLVQVSVA